MSLKPFVAAAALFFIAACGGANEPEETAVEGDVPASSQAPVSTSAPPAPTTETTSSSRPESDSAKPEPETGGVGQPTRIIIPAIDINAELVELGLNEDDSMETPDYANNLAGWYIEGPKPGEPGPAVIAAHVDNANGPDTFARLHELEPGDEIIATDDLGNEYTWTVGRSQTSNKHELPYDEIWSDTDQSVLRLITCSGAYVDGAYVENLIIYAT